MWYEWPPYVPVAVRRAKAKRQLEKLKKKGMDVQPVEISGRKIAATFWGKAWCEHLESFSDYENRLPRGRTYVRNGSVCHLEVSEGEVLAKVAGSEVYDVEISVKPLAEAKWNDIKGRCVGKIGTLLELLQGKLSAGVMQVMTDRENGLFPLPGEIDFKCSCPDWAVMCKHVAAVLYGVGARLDAAPEMLFLLRGVDQEELLSAEADAVAAATGDSGRRRGTLSDDDLSSVFGIDLSDEAEPAEAEPPAPAEAPPPAKKRTAKASRKKAKRRAKSAPKNAQPAAKASAKSAGNMGVAPRDIGSDMSGGEVAALRAKFGMNRSEFARLLGISPATVAKWESAEGRIRPHSRTLKAWNDIKGMSKKNARAKVAGK